MPANVPVPDHAAGDVFTEAMWDLYIRDNVNKLLDRGHRVLSVAAFLALTGLEDGDEAYVMVDATAETCWHLRYRLSTLKWLFLGGPALQAYITTDEVNAAAVNSVFFDLATVGPTVTTPFASDYDLQIDALTSGSSGSNTGAAAKFGAAATVVTDGAGTHIGANAAGIPQTLARGMRRTVAASVAIKLQYVANNNAVNARFRERTLSIRPSRVG